MTIATAKPETYTKGLGELIRAHRVYLGLSQRDMARRLDRDRRDYQRIENGRDACPPGMLSEVERLTDLFDSQVDAVLDAARTAEHLHVEVVTDETQGREWERNVAGRAALLASADPDLPNITLHVAVE